jgi:hypothetical protein
LLKLVDMAAMVPISPLHVRVLHFLLPVAYVLSSNLGLHW